MRELTRAGLPRPRTADGHYPVPWVSPPADLSQQDPDRLRRIATGWICQVCGLRIKGTGIAFIKEVWPVDAGDRLPDDVGIHAMDHGLLHEQTCAGLALTNCPVLRGLRVAGKLVACRVPAGSIEAYGADAERVLLEDL